MLIQSIGVEAAAALVVATVIGTIAWGWYRKRHPAPPHALPEHYCLRCGAALPITARSCKQCGSAAWSVKQ